MYAASEASSYVTRSGLVRSLMFAPVADCRVVVVDPTALDDGRHPVPDRAGEQARVPSWRGTCEPGRCPARKTH